MVDLKQQYLRIKPAIDTALLQVLDSSVFIGGNQVTGFAENLSKYLGSKHVIPCANGTDALQIAMMAMVSATRFSNGSLAAGISGASGMGRF